MAMLELKQVCASYGVIQALFDVSLTVNEGEIVCLIGANGAGKTTAVRAITGALPVSKGSIHFLGKPINSCRTPAIIRSGIACVPEGRRVFRDMTIEENLEIGSYVIRKDKDRVQRTIEEVYSLFPILNERRTQMAGTLSGGEQAMLVLGRAMMSHPKLMVLDEPSMGLAPVIVERAFKAIKTLNDAGTSILLVEQNANMALSISDRGYVLEGGVVRAEGTAEELQQSESVRKLYLGAAGA